MAVSSFTVLVPKYEDILDELGKTEVLLFSPKVQAFWTEEERTPAQKATFLALRREVVELRARLESARLRDIAQRLEELEPDLKAGIQSLQEEIEDLDDVIKFLNILNQITGFLSQVFLFV